nr:DUF6701 domain-containing protein [Vibrio sp. RE86]
MGFNYSSVINENDAGTGSLRQFLVNSQSLTSGRDASELTKSKLRQEGHTVGVDNAIFAKPISNIEIDSPLEFINSERTYIDARVLLDGPRPLSINNFREEPLNSDYGLQITDSDAFAIAGINWNRFDDAIYVRDSSGVQLVDNSFNDTRDSGVIIYDSQEIVVSDNLFNNTVNREDHNEQAAGLYLSNSDKVTVLRNHFVDTGDDHVSDGDHQWHASGVRVLYGNENKISQNTFQNTKGMAIDLRYNDAIGYRTPNDDKYNWAADVSNYAIDYPEFSSANSNGEVIGRVRLDNIHYSYAACEQDYEDLTVEMYLASGSATDSTIEGTDYLGQCGLDSQGLIVNCSLNTSLLTPASKITGITIDSCGNTSEMGQAINVEASSYDYGDAPNEDLATGWEETRFPVMSADNGARHAIDEDVCLYPGVVASCAFSLDEENDGQPSRDASLDQEDDGVEFNPHNTELLGSPLNVLITSYFDENGVEQPYVNELVVTASEKGYVSVWVDRNQDGSWDGFERNKQFISEKVIDSVKVKAGQNPLDLVLSAFDVHGESWVRVRYSTDEDSVNDPTGAAFDGEVEDYQVWVAAPSMGTAGCEAGLQNGSFEIFYTEDGHNGWDTPESSVAGWSIFQQDPTLDPHSAPFPQRRNHIEFNVYNAYVYSKSSDGSSNVAEMNVYHPTVMYQDVVTVPGERIRWSFDYSNRTYPDSYDNDQISLMFGSPDQDLVTEQVIDGKDYWVHHSGSYQVPAGQYVTRIAFKGNKPVGGSSGNILDNAKFGCEVGLDFGDLPQHFKRVSNNKAELVINDSRKVDPNLYIGSEPADVESEAKTSDFAKGDDADGFNDEFTFSTPLYLTRGDRIEIKGLPVKNTTGRDAVLKAYLDVNGDSKFDSSEETSVTLSSQLGAQSVDVSWDFSGASFTSNTQTFLRLELTGTGNLDHLGEIEDHLVYLVDDNIFPQPGRCDGFVQVKEASNNGVYQYAKWKAKGGEIVIDEINGNLNVSEIKAIGVSQVDGLTYGVSSQGSVPHKLYIAGQEAGAEFSYLADLKAAYDGVYIESEDGDIFTFNAGDRLYSDAKVGDSGKLGRANAGDVSPDGRYMLISRSSWHSIVRVELATGAFDTIQLGLDQGKSAPWSADFAFDLSGQSPNVVYALDQNLKNLYEINILTGSIDKHKLTLKIPSDPDFDNPEWPLKDSSGKRSSGGFGINKGGILFAMTNGGLHDLNQDGVIDDSEKQQPSTALYSVDIASRTIQFEMKGEEEKTTSNDAGGCAIHADFGDVPEALEGNNPATHLGTNESIKLGSTWSADLGPGYDDFAASDLSDDGVVFKDSAGRVVDIDNNPLTPGKQYSLYLNLSGGGSFAAWVSWDAQHWNKLPTGLRFTVPMDSSRGYVRVRYSSVEPESAYGQLNDGEVEDYSFEIGSTLNGLTVNAPSSPLTCEVAQYQVILDVDGGNLSQDVNVNVGFENAPSQCWFDASAFSRGQELGKALCRTGSKTLLFQPGQSLTRTIWVATDSELENITLVATEQDLGTAKESARFTKEGFKIVPLNAPNHYKAGETFGLRVERKVALDDQPQCITDPDYQGAKTFRFEHQTDTHKGKLRLDGTEIGDGTSVTLNFNAGASENIESEYFESGYLNVLAEYTPEQGNTRYASLESLLHFKPYALVVSDVNGDDTNNPIDSLSPFLPAETEFTVQVTAVAKGHTATDPLITQNFDAALANTEGFLANVVVPNSQVGSASDLSPSAPNTKVFSQGRLENTFEYGNVGTISTQWSVDSYDGYSGLSGFLNTQQSIENGGQRSEIGYFYPARFGLTSEFSVPTTRADNGEPWTYYGRPNVTVDVEVEAHGANGGTLSFYDTDVLEESELPSLATNNLYFNDDLPTCLTDQGVLLDSSNSAIDFAQQWQGGRWSLDSESYYFGRAEECWQQLDDVSLLMDFTNLDDSPLVDITGATLDNEALELGQNIDVRFGRLTLVDVAGPTNQRLPMAMNIEYWDGEAFILNDWHNEAAISVLGDFPDIDDLDPQPMEVGGSAPEIIEGALELAELSQGLAATLIGGSESGRVELPWAFSQGAENWLGYCWYTIEDEMDVCGDVASYQQPPISTATFGVSRASDNVIYIMERFE